MMKWLGALIIVAAAAAPAHAAEPVAGRWVTAEKDAVVAIKPCGRAASDKTVCGTVDKFLVPPPDGLDQRDINNPDPALRKRRLLGLPILSGFTADGDLWRGRIYDPKSGKSYRSVIRRKGANVLEVKGCIGPFCQTQVWKRVS
ncbi:DUF2147 domain-containing protein [Erythrobacter sp.]|uniref:DUF2147 domain-containing protein n=1 Tax=Erythrobacter sp. TaxID=1042 RepID=UPI0025E6D3A7|nr:DUF2147 domain-containing protein [Erythrobacter sp.]